MLALARRTKKNMPEDLTAEGKVNGDFNLKGTANGPEWSGDGEVKEIKLTSPSDNSEITVSSIPFSIPAEPQATKHRKLEPSSTKLEFGKFDLLMGTDRVFTARGWVSQAGYTLDLSGDTRIQKLLQVARMAGIPVLHPTADGEAKVDLQLAGEWSGFAAPVATGEAQLRAIRAEIRGVNAPLQIASASVLLLPDQIRAQNLIASFGTSTWKGSVQMPRGCGSPDSCLVQFDLHTDSVAADELARLLDPRNAKRPWYRFLSTSPAKPYLAALHASGKLSAVRVDFRKLVASKVSANVALENGKLSLTDLRGNVLGGSHSGEWTGDFTAQPPSYHGSGVLDHTSMEQVAQAMHDGWITGTVSASYEVSASGNNLSQITTSAIGKLKVEVIDGSLPHIELANGDGPLRIHRLAALLRLRDGAFDIEEGKLETSSGIFQLSGTASLGQTLNVKLERDSHQGYTITGTLPEPKVAPAVLSETRASLKP
jgi:autotransporter translocation and assembly factor TamB